MHVSQVTIPKQLHLYNVKINVLTTNVLHDETRCIVNSNEIRRC